MRISVIAGKCQSGKTTVVRYAGEGKRFTFIGSNPQSADMMRGTAAYVDNYPYKSPCARVRQFTYRADLHLDDDVPTIVSEPPGACFEQSSPILNQVYVTKKGIYELGALVSVIDGTTVSGPISRRSTDGLRMYNMIFESDVICVTRAEQLSEAQRAMIRFAVGEINGECEIVFFSPEGEGIQRMSEIIFGDSSYRRPLYC